MHYNGGGIIPCVCVCVMRVRAVNKSNFSSDKLDLKSLTGHSVTVKSGYFPDGVQKGGTTLQCTVNVNVKQRGVEPPRCNRHLSYR